MFSATKAFILCYLGVIMFGGATQVNASIRCCTFEVVNSAHTRLCTKKTMLTINGQFPGPTIYARRGDLITMNIVNRADQNISIHWHGVKMPQYPWSDGTNYVTQCPIEPGQKFTQQIILSDEEGTLWWHAHSDWARNSVYGAIVILPPRTESFPFPIPHAHFPPILIGDWWNTEIETVFKEFLETGGDPEVSNAFLFNGQPGDLYPCSNQDTYKLRVEYGKTYLIKLVNAALDNIMFFKIANHELTVVGADGAYTKPLTTDYVAIPPGQTLDLLLEANQPPSHYYMATRMYTSKDVHSPTTPTTAIIEYVGNYTPPPSPLLPSLPDVKDSAAINNFINRLRSLGNDVDVPKKVEEFMYYTLSMNLMPCLKSTCSGSTRFLASVNNVSFVLPRLRLDILQAYYRGINGVYTEDFPDFPYLSYDFTGVVLPEEEAGTNFGTGVRMLEYNTTVEVVLQGANHLIDHPIHLHGYRFYVVGYGLGNYNRIRDVANYNLVDPPLMQTIVVPKNGWAAIRFKANNPGVWYMHCHIERHISWGMGMVFIVKDGERPHEKMLPPPPDMPRC
ncbi:laccase-14-like [Salvia miltiorrhiza]|uniref:laccase-14-like n=1 Tax=Salvia miltiorrhiza TaxID=226208 RepID=UPI0025AC98D2|nr:laccase-14-like [Salvia miltiorrhiza]